MALDFQVVDVKLTGGMETKTEQKLVVPGKWLNLTNMALDQEYTPKIRSGHGSLVTTANGNGLATFNDELLTINGPAVSTVSTTATAASACTGSYGNIGIAKTEVYRSTGFQDSQDCAYGNGYIAYTWRDATGGTINGVKCSIVDATSGAPLLNAQALRSSATVCTPRVVFTDNAFFFIYRDGTTVYVSVVATSAPTTVGTSTSLLTGVQATNIDACPNPLGTGIIVVVVAGSGLNSVTAADIRRTGTTPAVSRTKGCVVDATIARATVQGLACCDYGDSLHTGVFYCTSTGGMGMAGAVLEFTGFTTSTANTAIDGALYTLAVAGPSHIVAAATGNELGSYRVLVVADQQSSYLTADFRPVVSVVLDTTLVATAGPTDNFHSACFSVSGTLASGPQGPFIAGKPFKTTTYTGGFPRMYVPMMVLENYFNVGANSSNPNAQCSFFLVNVDPYALAYTVVGHALYGTLGLYDVTLGGAAPSVATPCSSPAGADSVTFYSAQLERLTLQTVQGINITPTGICQLKFTRNDTVGPIRAQLGQSTFLAGGQLTSYGGAKQITEHGFLLYPEGVSVVVQATSGAANGITVGTHELVATYEWTDGSGQRHQSAPSPAIQFTVANANDRLSVIVPTLLLSQKTNVVIALWMTEASGTTFYRVVPNFTSTVSNTTSASTVTVLLNDTAGGSQICTDAKLRQGEILYSEPTQSTDTLPNIVAPPCSALAVHQNRVVLLADDDPGAFWFSQVVQPNTGLMFNPSLKGRLPVEGGKPYAVASLDEKLVFFCARRLYVVYGTGPKQDGTYSTYTEPQDIQSDVGCLDARSILAEMPDGILFKSTKGWYVLGRDLSTRYVGDGVASYDQYTVQSAVLVENQQQARFVINNSSTRRLTLVYSYLRDAWSLFQSGNTYAAADAIWWPGTTGNASGSDAGRSGNYVTISTASGLNQDTTNTYDSEAGNNAAFTLSGNTSWLHLSALESFQRVRRLYVTMNTPGGIPDSSFQLSISLNESSAGETFTFNTGTVYSATDGTEALDVVHRLAQQKCKSMQFSFNETPTAYNSNRLNGIQALALEIGMKRGVRKLPSAQQVG